MKKKRLKIFVIFLLGFGILGSIIYFTGTKETIKAIKNLNKNYIFLGILFYFLEYLFDILRLQLLVKGAGSSLNFWKSAEAIAVQVFFDLITPFNVGGQPFQVYILHKEGVPGGKATTVVMVKLLLSAIALITFVIYALLGFPEIFAASKLFRTIFNIAGFFLLFITLTFILGLYNPALSVNVLEKIIFFLYKLKLVKRPEKYRKKIIRNILLARESFSSYFGKKFIYFFLSFIFSLLMTLSVSFLVLSFVWGFGIHLEIKKGIAITSSLIFLVTFMPTPGGMGLGEGIFYLLYRNIIPLHLIGIIIFLWRFFTQYLTAGIGAYFGIKHFSDLIFSNE